MCNPKPLKHSSLSLAEIDRVLMPFFEYGNKGEALDDPSGITSHPCDVPGRIDSDIRGKKDLCSQPPEGEGSGGEESHVKLTGNTAGTNSVASSRAQESSTAGAAMPNQAPLRTPPDPYSKCSLSSRRHTKRIRFTGVMGEFLDGANIWNDFAIMEAERKAHLGEEPAIASPLATAYPSPSPNAPVENEVKQEFDMEDEKEQEYEEGRKEGHEANQGSGKVEQKMGMDRGPARATKTR